MKKIISIFKESFIIIYESFIYLFVEIKYLILSLISALKKNKKSIQNDLKKDKDFLEHVKFKDLKKNPQKLSDNYVKHQDLTVNKDNHSKTDEKTFKQDKHFDYSTKDINSEIKYNEKKEVNSNRKRYYISITMGVFIVFSIFITYTLWDLPDATILEEYNPPLTTRIYSSDGYIVSELATEKRLFVPADNIPSRLIDAFLSAEDKNFYTHSGIDYLGLLRAAYNNLLFVFGSEDNLEGASTITQQVAKNFLLTSDRTIRRKIREVIITKRIERQYSKEKIIELYLNSIYLGRGSYGVSMASLSYFDKPINSLSLAEIAFLASLPKAPAKYDLRSNYDGAKERRDWVIDRMLEDKKITPKEAEIAKAEKIDIRTRSNLRALKTNYAVEEVRKDLIKRFNYDSLYKSGLMVKTTINYQYQDYAYEALREGIAAYENKKGYKGPIVKLNESYTVAKLLAYKDDQPLWLNILSNNKEAKDYRNIVFPWQVAIVIDVQDSIAKVGFIDGSIRALYLNDNMWAKPYQAEEFNSLKQIFSNGDIIFVEDVKDKLIIRQVPEINGAILVMDPQTGDILAMQGGYSFLLSEFNRATQAQRQPGSALKTFIYLSAIADNILTTDKFLDAPYVIDDVGGSGDKKIRNSSDSYKGLITFRYAFEHSSNLATIRVANAVGTLRISNNLKNFGIYDSNIETLSEILGSREVTLLRMVKGYAMLVNGGKEINPNLINIVQDKEGKVLYKRDSRICNDCNNVVWNNQAPPALEDTRKKLIDDKDAYIIVNLMQGAVERGTGVRARVSGYNIGGKTGTSNDVKDAWFIGFSPDLVVGIYIGHDIPKSLDTVDTAANIAVPIFKIFMDKALKDRDPIPFRTPEGIKMRWVDYISGETSVAGSSNAILDIIKEGQEEKINTSNEDQAISIENEEGIY